MFVQDDFKVNNRLTVNAGLRYEIFKAPTEEENRLANFDLRDVPAGLRRRGRDEPQRQQEDALRQLRAAPRPHLRSDRRRAHHPAHRLRDHVLPGSRTRRQPARHQGAVRDLAERESRDQPARHVARANDRRPVPPIVPVKPQTTAELIAANPRVQGHSFENETPYAEQWHLGDRAPAVLGDAAGAGVRRQRRQAPHRLLQPQRSAAGTGIAAVAAAAPADCDASTTCCSATRATVDVQRRHG